MKLLAQDLLAETTTKGDLINALVPEGETVDSALPQGWLDEISNGDEEAYNKLRFGTAWWYPKGSLMGIPLPLTLDSMRIIAFRYGELGWEFGEVNKCWEEFDHG